MSIPVPLERRAAPRVSPVRGDQFEGARIRPGRDVRVLNVSRGGMLVEGFLRLLPGSAVEIQLRAAALVRRARGHVQRCSVSALGSGPPKYRAAVVFERPLDFEGNEDPPAAHTLPEPQGHVTDDRGSSYPSEPRAVGLGTAAGGFPAEIQPRAAGTAFVDPASTGVRRRGRDE